eukprot:scaffold28479_cov45-Phaeocystis_antarctica.AAC.1
MAAAVDMLVPCAGSVDQEGARRLTLTLTLTLTILSLTLTTLTLTTLTLTMAQPREGRGGDGGGERMVAAVRAELQPLLPAPAAAESVREAAAENVREAQEVLGEVLRETQGAAAEATGA